jgi:hypothetical protein
MQLIPLITDSNQSLNITLGGDNYFIKINDVNNTDDELNVLMASTIQRNNIDIISGFRILAGEPLIPFKYKENGNFIFFTNNDEFPDYRQFGITQFLYFFDADELREIRA